LRPPMNQQLSPCPRQGAAASRPPVPVQLPTGRTIDQVPPIRDLYGLGRPTTRPVGVEAPAVPAHHDDSGMRFQPRRHRLGRAVRQQVHEAMALEVAEKRAVAMAAPPGPVVDAEDAWWWVGAREWTGLHQPEDRLPADAHAQVVGQTCAGLTAQRQADALQRCPEALGQPGARAGKIGEALGENAPRTLQRTTDIATDADVQDQRRPTPGQIAQCPFVGAMDTVRALSTERARPRAASGRDVEREASRLRNEGVNVEATAFGQEHGQARGAHTGAPGNGDPKEQQAQKSSTLLPPASLSEKVEDPR